LDEDEVDELSDVVDEAGIRKETDKSRRSGSFW
jgi:hypothetical protein